MKKLQVSSCKLQVNRLGMAGLLALVLVLVLSPSLPDGEAGPAGTVTVIKVAQANPNPYQRLYEEMLYPTVRITTPQGCGSGVVISYRLQVKSSEPETLILTAAHVVGKESIVRCEMFRDTGCEICDASVVMTDTAKDLALLRIETTDSTDFADKYKAKLAPRDYVPYLFAPVYAVGCSLGLPPRPSSGIITAITTPFYSPLTKGD